MSAIYLSNVFFTDTRTTILPAQSSCRPMILPALSASIVIDSHNPPPQNTQAKPTEELDPSERVLTKTLPLPKHLSTRSPESLPPVNNLSSSSRGSRGLCSVSDCPTSVVVAFVVDEDDEGSSDGEEEEVAVGW